MPQILINCGPGTWWSPLEWAGDAIGSGSTWEAGGVCSVWEVLPSQRCPPFPSPELTGFVRGAHHPDLHSPGSCAYSAGPLTRPFPLSFPQGSREAGKLSPVQAFQMFPRPRARKGAFL